MNRQTIAAALTSVVILTTGASELQAMQSAPVSEHWPTSTPQAQGLDPAPLLALDSAIKAGAFGFVDRIAVVRHGKLVLNERYERDYVAASADYDLTPHQFNYRHPDWHPYYQGRDVHSLQSVTKSIASALIGIAVGRGEIEGVDTPLLTLLKGYDLTGVDPELHKATLEDLLTMRTGIEWHESDRPIGPTNTTIQMEGSDDWVRFTLDQPMDAAPGEKFNYNSGTSHMMSAIIREATGYTADKYAEEYLFGPLGIEDYHWKITPAGLPDTEGGLYLEAEQLLKLGQLYLNRGAWEGTQVLPESWVDQSVAHQVESINGPFWNYGYQWWLINRSGIEIWAGMGFGDQYLIVIPDYDLVGVVNSWNLFGGIERRIQPEFISTLLESASNGGAAEAKATEWVLPVLASGSQFLNALHTDPDGHTYITGYFSGALNLAGIQLRGAGGGDPFLVKLDNAGQAVWGRQASGSGWNGGRSIDLDEEGSVYVVGRFQDDMAFGTDTLRGSGDDDIFVSRYSAQGDFLWARSVGGAGTDRGHGVAVDRRGNVFVAGEFEDTIRVGTETIKSGGGTDPVLIKFGPDGNMLWARAGSGAGAGSGYEVATDAEGNAYLVGEFSGNLSIGDQTLQAIGEADGFIVKYSPDGLIVWVRTLVGAGRDLFEDVAVGPEGDILIAGSFQVSADLGGQTLRSAGGKDLVIAKLAPDGSTLRTWTLGGPEDDGFSGFGQSVSVIPGEDGSFTVATAFQDTLTLGEHVLRSRGGSDVLLAHFGGPEDPLWVESCGGSEFEGFVGVGRDRAGTTYASTNFTSESIDCGGEVARRLEDRRFGAAIMKVTK